MYVLDRTLGQHRGRCLGGVRESVTVSKAGTSPESGGFLHIRQTRGGVKSGDALSADLKNKMKSYICIE